MQKLKFIAMSLVSALCLAGAADVWEDCAWRLGDVTDANANGIFDNGDLTEYFHAADASHASHKISCTAEPADEDLKRGLLVTNTEVTRVTEGVSASQNVIRFRHPAANGTNYTYKVATPCQITGDKYTVICRFRMAKYHPDSTTSLDNNRRLHSWVFSSGWCWSNWRDQSKPQGGNGLMFGVNGSGEIVVYCAQNVNTFSNSGWQYIPESWYSPVGTNYWVDAAIVADGTHVSIYCSAENKPCRWLEYDPVIPEGASIMPAEGFKVDCGGEGGGNKKNGFCGDIAELAAWNRALTRTEIVEAFGKCGPALFRVGTKGRTQDFCGGAATAGTTSISTDMRNPGAVSRTLNAGGRLEIPFTVQSRNNRLPQLFRIVPSADSASGSVRMAIDGNVIDDLYVRAGRMSKVFVAGEYLTTGSHTAIVTCLSGPVSWDVVDLCGSFRYDFGVQNIYPQQYGIATTYWGDGMANAVADAFAGDWGRYDMKYLPCAAGYEGTKLIDKRIFRFHWTPGDLSREHFAFNVEFGAKNGRGDEVLWKLLWNDAVVSAPAARVKTAFDMDVYESNLAEGDNVFCMDTDTVIDNSSNAGVIVKSVTVTVKKPKTGFILFVR